MEVSLEGGEILRLVTHDTLRVERLVAESGGRVDYHRRWGLLDFGRAEGVAHVSVSTKADIGPCVQNQEGGVLMHPEEGEDQAAFAQRLHGPLVRRSQDG